MINISYCRFESTLSDLLDCQQALRDLSGNVRELRKDEARAADALIRVCQEIADQFNREGDTV